MAFVLKGPANCYAFISAWLGKPPHAVVLEPCPRGQYKDNVIHFIAAYKGEEVWLVNF